MINKLKVIYNKKQRFYLIVLFVGLSISAVLEMIGVGAIPVFVNLLLDPEKLVSYLPQSDLTNFFVSKNYLSQILFVSLFLLAVFLFKNFFLFCTIYLQARIFRNIKVENSKRLFQAYVNSPYYLHLSRNPAVLANNVTTEVSLSTRHLESLLLLTREFLVLIAVFILLVAVDPGTVLIVFAVVGSIVTIIVFYSLTYKEHERMHDLLEKHGIEKHEH